MKKDHAAPAAATAAVGESAPTAADLPLPLKLLERFLPKEAGPIFDLFDGPFDTVKLWAAIGAVAIVGPKIEVLLGGRWSSAMPAASITVAEKVTAVKDAIDKAEPIIGGEPGEEPSFKMNPLLAATLAALMDEVFKFARDKLRSM